MTTIKAFIKRHPLPAYFALTFAISWGGVLLAIGGPGAIPATPAEFKRLLLVGVLALLAGPPIAGLLLTGLVDGRAGYRALLARLRRWRVGARWYAVALLTAPLLVMVTLFALVPVSPDFLPGIFATDDPAFLLVSGIAYGLAAGIFEELGWTGFALPRLRERYSVLATGLILGSAWGAWHFMAAFLSSGTDTGSFAPLLLLAQLLFYVATLPAYRVLMVWVYDRTRSLLVAMLMHACLTASIPMILMPAATDMVLGAWYLGLAAVLWAIVAAVVMAGHGQLTLKPTVIPQALPR